MLKLLSFILFICVTLTSPITVNAKQQIPLLKFQKLYDFCSPFTTPECENGANPMNGLKMSDDGKIYGFTESSIFQVKPNKRMVTPLFKIDDSFLKPIHSSGGLGISDILVGKDGIIYGTARVGGSGCGGNGCGTIFSLNPQTKKFHKLFNFKGGQNGRYPTNLLLGKNNKIYGITKYGGRFCGTYGCGTIFSFNPKVSTFRTLYVFLGRDDGSFPDSITKEKNGVIYGTTSTGGRPTCSSSKIFGCGTVFKFESVTKTLTTLHDFQNKHGGTYPLLIVLGKNHKLYGVTQEAGDAGGGTIFELNLDGSGFRILHQFSLKALGNAPCTGLSVSPQGKLYGALATGGSKSLGSIFVLNTHSSQITVLHEFIRNDGSWPNESFIFDKNVIYGTTQWGGASNRGTIYRLIFR